MISNDSIGVLVQKSPPCFVGKIVAYQFHFISNNALLQLLDLLLEFFQCCVDIIFERSNRSHPVCAICQHVHLRLRLALVVCV